ncbi:MAG: ArsR family transcriptional regulator [Oscillospiraceae bacterium]|nr:ArsR family transcriptional regulator [Oscillospiraceae bacterium]
MLHIKNLDDGMPVFKALGSELRVRIIKLLIEHGEMNMNELASALGVTNGALTSHIKQLSETGLVTVLAERSGHGNQKLCRVAVDRLLVDIQSDEAESKQDIFEAEIPIGHYSDYAVFPTCGLSTTKKLVGVVDDPRYFAYPERIDAGILWFTRGYVEYIIPNLLPVGAYVEQLTLSVEISSEAPGVNNDWPSDISFLLNDVKLGTWTSPGDYGDMSGIFTPGWWFPNWNQYGLLKMIVVNRKGTFVDGLQISDVGIDRFQLDYKSTIRFKFQVADDARNVGGLTLFGNGFGNYDQGIRVRIACKSVH